MTKPDDVLYIHEPREGFFVTGVPARDLTREDVERMPVRRLREAVATGLYRKATAAETAPPAAKPAKPRKPRAKAPTKPKPAPEPENVTADGVVIVEPAAAEEGTER